MQEKLIIHKGFFSFFIFFVSDQNCQLFIFKKNWQQYGWDNKVLKQ